MDTNGSDKNIGKTVILLLITVIVAAACGAAVWVFYTNNLKYKESNGVLYSEISKLRTTVYIADRDIGAGELIITAGDDQNVSKTEIYGSLDTEIYFGGSGVVYAKSGITAGSPVLFCDVSESYVDFTEVVEEVEQQFETGFAVTASFVDTEGNELSEPRELTLPSGMTEAYFSSFAESISGYVLSSVRIGDDNVLSFGVSEIKKDIGSISVSYYTDETGLSRTQILSDIDVVFTYANAEESEGLQDSSLFSDRTESEEDEEEDMYAAITADSINQE